MIVSEHPEEALEQAIAGTLPLAQRGPLEEHLAVCSACKAHLALASVALLSFQPHPWDGHADRLNIDRAMAFAPRRGSPFSMPLGKRALWLSAAAVLALGGIASAAWEHATRAQRLPEAGAIVPLDTARHKVVDERAPVEDTSPSSESAAPPPLDASASPSNAPPGNALTVPSASAAALFRKASQLRASGEPDAAIAVFQRLQKLFPDSRESKLSLVIAGRLLLGRGRSAQALAEFDQYLAGRGAASEDALAGRAAALQALGQTDSEAGAWQRLLTAYPKSVYDKRAKARLSVLRPTQAEPADSNSP